MSKSIALDMLSSANNGEQILQILDSIAQDLCTVSTVTESDNVPTLDVIEFWWYDRGVVTLLPSYSFVAVIRDRQFLCGCGYNVRRRNGP